MIPVGTPCYLVSTATHRERTGHICIVVNEPCYPPCRTIPGKAHLARVKFVSDGGIGCIGSWSQLRPITPPGTTTDIPQREPITETA